MKFFVLLAQFPNKKMKINDWARPLRVRIFCDVRFNKCSQIRYLTPLA